MPLDYFTAPQNNAAEQQTEDTGYKLDYFRDPTKRTAADIAARSLFAGRSFEELQAELTENGYTPPDQKASQGYNLALKRKKLETEGIGTLQAYKQFYQPFGNIVSLPIGGRSVGSRAYQEATKRFNEGNATDDDLDAIATYDALQTAKKNLEDSGVFGKAVSLAGTLGQIVPETLAGGAVLSGAAKGYQALRGAKSVAEPIFIAAGTKAPLISPAAITEGTKWFGTQAAVTALSPSMFVPMAQEINVREGRDANHWKGYPTAYVYGVANNLVLGHLQKGVTGNVLATAAKKGPIAALEMSGIEDAAALIDSVLPKAYRTGIEGSNVSKILKGYREGKDITDPLEMALAQTVVFGLFGAMHREAKPNVDGQNKAAVEAFDKAMSELKARGMTDADAAHFILKLNGQLGQQLANNPYVSRSRLLKNLDRITDPTLREYYEKLIDATVPERPYGIMHDEIAKESDPRISDVNRDQTSPLTGEVIRNEKGFAFEPRIDERIPQDNLIAREAAKESRSLFDRLMRMGADPKDAATIAQRAFDRTLERAAAPEKEAGKFAGKGVDRKVVTKTGASPEGWADKLSKAPGYPGDKTKAGGSPFPAGPTRGDQVGTPKNWADKLSATEGGASGDSPVQQSQTQQKPPESKPQKKSANSQKAGGKQDLYDFSKLTDQQVYDYAPFLGIASLVYGKPRSVADIVADMKKAKFTPERVAEAIARSDAARERIRIQDEAKAAAERERLATAAKEQPIEATPQNTPPVSEKPTGQETVLESPRINGPQNAPVPTSKPEIAPETKAQTARDQISERLAESIRTNPLLDPAKQAEYMSASASVMQSIPELALIRINQKIKKAVYFNTAKEVALAHLYTILSNKDLAAHHDKARADMLRVERGEIQIAGSFDSETGTLLIDGSVGTLANQNIYGFTGGKGTTAQAKGLFAHEVGHALDGHGKDAISLTQKWQDIANSEIAPRDGSTPLTEYAKTDLGESFAEFSRILYGSDIPTSQIEKDFPKASKFFKDKMWWPAERGGNESKPQEMFNEKIETGKEHIDTRIDKPLATAARETPFLNKYKPVVDAVTSVFGERARGFGDEFHMQYHVEFGDNRYLNLDPIGNDVKIDYGTKGGKTDEMTAPPPKAGVRPGSISMARDLSKLAKELAKNGVGIRYDAEQKRHDFYTRVLSETHEVRKSESDDGVYTVEWQPKPPVKKSLRDAVKAGGAPKKPRPKIEEIKEPLPDYMEGVKKKKPDLPAAPPEKEPQPEPESVGARGYKEKEQSLEDLNKIWSELSKARRKGIEGQVVSEKIKAITGEFPDINEVVRVGPQERPPADVPDQVFDTLASARDQKKLTKQQWTVLNGRLNNKTLEEVSAVAGQAGGTVSKSRTEQVEKSAWMKLQELDPETFGDYETVDKYLKSLKPKLIDKESLSEDEFARQKNSDIRNDPEPPSELRIPTLKEVGDAVRAGADYQGSMRKFIRRWLTAPGGLTDSAFAAKIARDGELHTYVADVRNAEKDLGKAIGGWDKATPEMIRDMNAALTPLTPDGLAAVAKIRNTFANGADVLAVLGRMREQIDTLSKRLIDTGAIPAELMGVIQGNLGAYLTRSYRVFSDPNWYRNVPEDVKNRFKSWLRAELTSERGKVPEESEIDGIMKSLLVNGKAAENPLAFIAGSKLGSRDLSILKSRKDIPPELRALWGEVLDPLANYVNSVARMSTLLVNHKFLTRVRDEGLGRHFFEKKDLGKFNELFPNEEPYLIAPEDSKAMGPLAGLYTTKGLKDAFDRSVAKEALPAYLQTYMKFLALTKYSKTIGSHVTHIRNFTSNVGFAVANGHWQMGNFKDAMRELAVDSEASRQQWKEYLRLGVVGDNVHANEFRDIINDALGINSPFMGVRMGIATENRIADWSRRGFDLAQKLYTAEDAVWKVYAYKNELARYKKAYPEWTDEQHKQKAAEIVRNTYPTYSMVSPAVKAIRRLPIVGSFVSFPAEVIRTTYHTVRQALTEIQDPRTREIGYTRLGGMITSSVLSSAVSLATAAMFGIDSQDRENIRRYLPEWSKNSQLLYLGKDSSGRYRYVDMSRNDPHSYLSDAVTSVFRADSPDAAALSAAQAVAKPFVEEELGTRNILDIVRNKKEQGGTVYNPMAPFADRAGAVIQHGLEPLVPGSYSTARRTAMALAGAKEQKTGQGYDSTDELVGNAGVRVSSVDLSRSLGYKGLTYTHSLTDAANLLTTYIRAKGSVSPEELATAAKQTDDARRELFNEFRRDIIAAERLGMTKQEIRAALTQAGVSRDEVSRLMNDNYKPFIPDTKGVPAQQRERAIGLRR